MAISLRVFREKAEMGRAAASLAAGAIREAIAQGGIAQIVLATGASQFEMLSALVQEDIDWSSVTAFHLDEYLGLPTTHPASFRKYLHERFVAKVPVLHAFHGVDGEAADPQAECDRLRDLIGGREIDVACIGIGENGHIAFNDPPADFETEEPFIVVELDEACRRQQLGEGWFPSLQDVPTQAISMSVRQIMKAKSIVCTVPDARKAEALRNALEGEVTNTVPASILQLHPACTFFADEPAVALLSKRP